MAAKKVQQSKLEMVHDAIERVRCMKGDTVMPKKGKGVLAEKAVGEASDVSLAVYECDPGTPLDPVAVDGMAEWIEDEPVTGFEWDIEIENPPYVGKGFDMKHLPYPDKPHPQRNTN